MSRIQALKVHIQQRLAAAVEEIFGLLDQTIAECEEETSRRRRRRLLLLDVAPKPETQTTGKETDVFSEEQQRWSSSLDQDDPPQPPRIKEEEEEELWTSLEEQLQGLEEADGTMFTSTADPVKTEEEKPSLLQRFRAEVQKCLASRADVSSEEQQRWSSSLDQDDPPQPQGLEEVNGTMVTSTTDPVKRDDDDDDDEEAQTLQLHQSQTVENREGEYLKSEPEEEDCRRPELDRNSVYHFQTSQHIEDRSFYWMETRDPETVLNMLHNVVPTGDEERKAKSYTCSECGKVFGHMGTLRRHMRCHTGEKPFGCTICSRRFTQSGPLVHHLRLHTGEKPFACSVCGKQFTQKGNLTCHMKVHTGEKPYSCTVCGKRFTRQARVKKHKCVVESRNSLQP